MHFLRYLKYAFKIKNARHGHIYTNDLIPINQFFVDQCILNLTSQ